MTRLRRYTVGVDCGTSFVKGTSCTEDGRVVHAYRVLSPVTAVSRDDRMIDPNRCWRQVKSVLARLLQAAGDPPGAICVSAVTPVLTAFDKTAPGRSVGVPYWYLPPGFRHLGADDFRSSLTASRLELLEHIATSHNIDDIVVTDLAGYFVFRLTGSLSINTVALSELGIDTNGRRGVQLAKNSPPTHIGPPIAIAGTTCDIPGIQDGVPVCFGCPDSVASLIGAGLSRKSDLMLYLGTFGLLLRLDTSVEALLTSASLPCVPYTWLLSVPDLGPTIESLARQWFPARRRTQSLHAFDASASRASPGANGLLYVVPYWRSLLRPHGAFAFVGKRREEGSAASCRAVLESLGYAIRALVPNLTGDLHASGGGAGSRIWLQALATVLRRDIEVRTTGRDASGAAMIASRTAWKTSADVSGPTVYPDIRAKAVERNVERATKLYATRGQFEE